jgi:predicted nucleic acid-binding protein
VQSSDHNPVPAVGDSSPLILFAGIGRFDLLREVFGEVVVPPAVWDEVVRQGAGRPGVTEVQSASWILQRDARDEELVRSLSTEVGTGEAQAITLAAQIGEGTTVLLDDRKARRIARSFGLTVIGSAGLLGLAKDRGLISAVRPLLNDLRVAGLYLSEEAARELLLKVGEAD